MKKKIIQSFLDESIGYSPAETHHLINETFIRLPVKKKISLQQFRDLIHDTRLNNEMGKKSIVNKIEGNERDIIHYHESGHAFMMLLLSYLDFHDPPQRMSLISRTKGSLGHTISKPNENKKLMSKNEILARIMTLLGGRVAEKLYLKEGNYTTGASNDIDVLTKYTTAYIKGYGMDNSIGIMTGNELNKDELKMANALVNHVERSSIELFTLFKSSFEVFLDKTKKIDEIEFTPEFLASIVPRNKQTVQKLEHFWEQHFSHDTTTTASTSKNLVE